MPTRCHRVDAAEPEELPSAFQRVLGENTEGNYPGAAGLDLSCGSAIGIIRQLRLCEHSIRKSTPTKSRSCLLAPEIANSQDGPPAMHRPKTFSEALATQFEGLCQRNVALVVDSIDVVEQTAPFGNHHQQTPPATEILFIDFKVFSERKNFFGEDSDLHICRTSILVVPTIGFDRFRFLFHTTSAHHPKNITSRAV